MNFVTEIENKFELVYVELQPINVVSDTLYLRVGCKKLQK